MTIFLIINLGRLGIDKCFYFGYNIVCIVWQIGGLYMSKEIDNNNGIGKVKKAIITILLIIALASSIFSIYEIYILSTIENTIRYIVMGVLALIDIFWYLKP